MLYTAKGIAIVSVPRKLPVHLLALLREKLEPRSHKDKECKGFFSIETRARMR